MTEPRPPATPPDAPETPRETGHDTGPGGPLTGAAASADRPDAAPAPRLDAPVPEGGRFEGDDEPDDVLAAPPPRVTSGRPRGPRVGLFATCLVDLMRPSVGFAAVKLLEDAGCVVDVPAQTCCGQPAFNSGDRRTARDLAAALIATFEPYDYVVVPSGSCGGMIARHFPELFAEDPDLARRAQALSAKTHELVSFLHDVLMIRSVDASFAGAVTYHDSCSGLRELNVRDQPRRLLRSVEGLKLVELSEADVCCGFGGTFAVKYGELSDAIVTKKAERVEAAAEQGATTLLAGDLGCLLNMAGKLGRRGSPVRVRHVAEVLAGMADGPAIGEPAPREER